MLAYFLQLPHLHIHHHIMPMRYSPWVGLSQWLSTVRVLEQGHAFPVQNERSIRVPEPSAEWTICQSSGARPYLPSTEWTVCSMQLRISHSCTAVWGFSHPLLLSSLFPFTSIRSSSHLKGSLYFCFPTYLSSTDILLSKSLAHLISSWCCLSEDVNWQS